jgi:hypothetical protein
MNSRPAPSFSEASPSIQTHLGIIQSVIQRMATNSTSCKTWCITIVSAILVIVADKGKPNFVWIAILPTLLFAVLDAYYMALEKGFRDSYSQFINKLHAGCLSTEDLYSISPVGQMNNLQIYALKSFSVWGFYATLIALVLITRIIVIGN